MSTQRDHLYARLGDVLERMKPLQEERDEILMQLARFHAYDSIMKIADKFFVVLENAPKCMSQEDATMARRYIDDTIVPWRSVLERPHFNATQALLSAPPKSPLYCHAANQYVKDLGKAVWTDISRAFSKIPRTSAFS